jgi:hypothetical protein
MDLSRSETMLITSRYGDALAWADALHRDQRRKGKAVPYLSRLITVSGLVLEEGGTEDQTIVGLLHEAIEDAGSREGAVAAAQDSLPRSSGAQAESSLLVSAADKAHNACDMVLDTGRDPAMWSKFNAGLEGSAWYLLRMHQQLSHRLPQSRSTELLGEAVREILVSAPFQRIVPEGARCQQQRRAGASIKLASDSAQPPAIARGWAAQDSGPGWRVIDAWSRRQTPCSFAAVALAIDLDDRAVLHQPVHLG